jgi:hypothetical protein
VYFKNARQKLIEQGVLEAGVAPSYYLEGLLYNAPDYLYVNTYQDTMVNVINWLWAADRSTALPPGFVALRSRAQGFAS